MGRYDRRNVAKRLQRTARHETRALEENSKTITQFPFISNINVYFYGGSIDMPHDEFVVHFNLKRPVLLKHFRELLKNKLRGATIE